MLWVPLVMHEVPKEFYDETDAASRCPACLNPRFVPYTVSNNFGFPIHFHRCQCGLIKQVPLPNEQFFEWFFNSEIFLSSKETDTEEIWGFYDYFNDEQSRLRTSKARYNKLASKLGWSQPLSIMKIGPSTGTFLSVAARKGHSALGCDVSDRFVGFARDEYGVQIDHGRFERMDYAPESFDVVLLFNVIENVPNIEEFVDATSRSLKPGGCFVLNHVEMDFNLIAALQRSSYFLFRPPICYGFNQKSLTTLLGRYELQFESSCRDVRYMHIEKISTLLRWRWLLKISHKLGLSKKNFPIWAYPSHISIYRKLI